MVRHYEWEPSTVVDLRIDPMAYWLVGHGREFFVRQVQGPADEKWDFGVLGAIDIANPVEPLAGDEHLLSVQKPQSDAWWQDMQEFTDAVGMQDPRVFPMPVPRALQNGDQLDKLSDLDGPPVFTDHAKAVVGIIDHAICLPHYRFRNAQGGTRILRAWHQSGVYQSDARVPFGREYSAAEIDAAIRAADGNENDALRELGLVGFGNGGETHLARGASHGTHVLDLAAGAEPGTMEAPPPIIAVNLPPIVARETTGAFLGMYFVFGVEFILRRARQLAPGLPVIINFSFALSGGPRGGVHPLTRCLRQLIRAHKAQPEGGQVTLVTAAGNRNLAQSHGWQRLKDTGEDGAPERFSWKLQPGDTTANMLDIWFSSEEEPDAGLEFEPEILLKLVAPGGQQIDDASFAEPGLRHLKLDGKVIGQALLRREGEKRLSLSLILAPTDPGRSGREPAPPGEWQVMAKVVTSGEDPVIMEAWVMRDDVIPGFPDTGRQSYLIDRSKSLWTEDGWPTEWDAPDATSGLRHGGSLNVLSLGDMSICVGAAMQERGVRDRETGPSPYSGGPLPRKSPMYDGEQVDVSAIADRSKLRPGVRAAGTQGGARVAMNGSSVAAPQVVRAHLDAVSGSAPPSTEPRMGRTVLEAPPELPVR
ncbi:MULTISPECIES: hypothetical protein [unclassified Ruegeria]|uniref:hypothetical protein n=1 Tax=unclassified Ruegeria TaxID=2625375 RepID=UPI001489E706|nr:MULTISPECIES: hypothetical protein [unclassified Ruegeria]